MDEVGAFAELERQWPNDQESIQWQWDLNPWESNRYESCGLEYFSSPSKGKSKGKGKQGKGYIKGSYKGGYKGLTSSGEYGAWKGKSKGKGKTEKGLREW